MKKYKRSIILINSGFQFRFMLASLIIVIFAVTSVYVTIQHFFVNSIELGINKNLNHDHIYFQILNEQQIYFNSIFIFMSIVLLVGTFFWGLYFSHRIAGPMYKLNKYFSDANKSKGEKLPRLFFRKHDFFHEIPHSINLYLTKNDLLKLEEQPELKDKESSKQVS